MSTSNQDQMKPQLQHAQEVQEKYTDELMSKPHVVGVAIGFTSHKAPDAAPDDTAERKVCLVVMVDELVADEDLPEEDRIPTELDGVPVEKQLTGLFSAGFAAE